MQKKKKNEKKTRKKTNKLLCAPALHDGMKARLAFKHIRLVEWNFGLVL